jgi:hypothetical protein
MSLSVFTRKTVRLMLAVVIVILAQPELLACSGPGAAKTIRNSILIGWSLGGLSVAMVVGAGTLLRRRSLGRRMPWIVVPLVLHPAWWTSVTRGDCGYALRSGSAFGTFWIAVAVGLAIYWPSIGLSTSKHWKWQVAGAVAGVLAGIPVVIVVLEGLQPQSVVDALVALLPMLSFVMAGAWAGGHIYRVRTGAGRWNRFRLRDFLLLPVIVAPICVVLLPVMEYNTSYTNSTPSNFLVVDAGTGLPIPHATVQIIDPRFGWNDTTSQVPPVETGPTGVAALFLFANARGSEGLLGRTETISYNPQLIQVKAAGYRPFITSLAKDPPVSSDRLTAPPLGLPFPPPPSVTIRLTPSENAR